MAGIPQRAAEGNRRKESASSAVPYSHLSQSAGLLVAMGGELPMWTFDKRAAKVSGAESPGR